MFYFNPRSQCRERRSPEIPISFFAISIHVPNVGNDLCGYAPCITTSISIHVPNVGNDVFHRCQVEDHSKISIHVPNVGNDIVREIFSMFLSDFNPRSQCRERREQKMEADIALKISIHVPNVGNDHTGKRLIQDHGDFNPRSQCRERRIQGPGWADQENFNPRSQCRERPYGGYADHVAALFQSTFPM